MQNAELILDFSRNAQVKVSFDGVDTEFIAFENPITDKDRSDIRWYLETYGTSSLADPDDKEAKRIQTRLTQIGQDLFKRTLGHEDICEIYHDFRKSPLTNRVLTIGSQDAEILSIPWELLHDPKSVFLFRENPHISIRRKITGATKGRAPFRVKSKDQIHLLFVVSRPTDVGFIDPRADALAVLDALDHNAKDRVTWEFLKPATLTALHERICDTTKPAVDILHFDGHGAFHRVSKEEVQKNPEQYGKYVHSEIMRARELRGAEGNDEQAEEIGFLVFENENKSGKKQLITAQDLAANLSGAKVGLVILSACQSASEGNPIASVAGQLSTTGIPAILAMTHSVLVETTRKLFGKFYESLAKGRGIATALDDARIYLANNPEKFEVRRDNKHQTLKLHDWFLPALFQSGPELPLLTANPADTTPAMPEKKNNLRPLHEAGFFGRRRELWQIDRWFASGKTRRISITGYGGQGKTELAMEAGRWLLRTGMFERAVFVDYAQVQTDDALAMAVSTLSTVLDQALINSDEATDALSKTPTLIILDNLETISQEALNELLTAATNWSNAGGSRVILTSRTPEFNHHDYRTAGMHSHRNLPLDGLGSANAPEDALALFTAISLLPPDPTVPPPDLAKVDQRDQLVRLFDRVGFHPLSIAVLAQQIKSRTVKELDERLEDILNDDAMSDIAAKGTPRTLIASLQLSLERLSEDEREAVKKLGVFQGGAFEDDLLAITELGEIDHSKERKRLESFLAALESGDQRTALRMMGTNIADDAEIPTELADQLSGTALEQLIDKVRTLLAQFPAQPAENLWPGLRRQLENAGLIQAEKLPGIKVPFLRFHPTLAPMLWASLPIQDRDTLTLAHRKRYYQLANYLYHEDSKDPLFARAIAKLELPNMLHAVHSAMDAGDPDAADFVVSLNRFLNYFGMRREAESLNQRAKKAGGQRGSKEWYILQSNLGEQLLTSGRVGEAMAIFQDIIEVFDDHPTYERSVTLGRLGRCYETDGRPDLAENYHRQALTETEHLEQNEDVKKLRGTLHTDLADALRHQGKYTEARKQYELGLEIDKELNDQRSQGVTLIQLGSLAKNEGDLQDALKRYRKALKLFQQLGEPEVEAVAHHQLGMVFDELERLDHAETHYRESARLKVLQGNLVGAAKTWNCLAILCETAGNPEAAETWFRMAIDAGRTTEDNVLLSTCLSNLAELLRTQPNRMNEAQQLAEEALVIKKTLEPGVAEIWNTYGILARIADQQGQPDQANGYRKLAREAKRNFAGTAHHTRQHAKVAFMVVGAVGGIKEAQTAVEQLIQQGHHTGGEASEFARSVERILAGERDEESLCQNLVNFAPMIETILRGIDDPTTLKALLPDHGEDSQ